MDDHTTVRRLGSEFDSRQGRFIKDGDTHSGSNAVLAQLEECHVGNVEVTGSIPVHGSGN